MLVREVPKRKFLPTLERSEPVTYDHTSTQYFKKCPRMYFYRMVLGRVAHKQDLEVIFGWGSSIHKFAEVLWLNGSFDDAMRAALPIYVLPPKDSKWHYLDPLRFAQTCGELYKLYLKESTEKIIKVFNIEQSFNFDFPDGEQGGGRFDANMDWNGQLWVRDWKTTTKQANWFAMGLNPNDQATRYAYALSRLRGWSSENPVNSLKAAGVIFYVIQNLPGGKTASAKPVISHHMITKSLGDLLTWESEQLFIHKQIAFCRDNDVWPMYETHCGFCDYANICRQPSDASREYKLRTEYAYKPWDHNNVEQKVVDG